MSELESVLLQPCGISGDFVGGLPAQATVAAVDAVRNEERRRMAAVPVRMPRDRPRPLMLLTLVMSATGYVPAQMRWLAPQSPEIPPLPKEARQEPLPSICLPTCSAALSIELKRLRELQTVPASQD